MANNKVDWSDEKTLKKTIIDATSYNNVLTTLGLKPVGSNVKTLKKYIEKYDIDTSHFGYNKELKKSTDNEKWFTITASLNDGDLDAGVKLELDWSKQIIQYLRQSGFSGGSDEEIIWKLIEQINTEAKLRFQNYAA